MLELIEKAQSGAIPAQSALVVELEGPIGRMASYFGRITGFDEDDLRQEAWVAILEMLPKLDLSIGTPEQHLIKRARWRILDTIRKQQRRRHSHLSDLDAEAISWSDPPGDFDIGPLLDVLTPIQRRILRGLLEGYTWREVGTQLGCSSANVAYHVRRIRETYIAIHN